MKNIIKNKKAQIGSATAWFPVFIIVFFIIIVFLFFTLALAAKNKLTDKDKIISETRETQSLSATKLISPIIYSIFSVQDLQNPLFIKEHLQYWILAEKGEVREAEKLAITEIFTSILEVASSNKIYYFSINYTLDSSQDFLEITNQEIGYDIKGTIASFIINSVKFNILTKEKQIDGKINLEHKTRKND